MGDAARLSLVTFTLTVEQDALYCRDYFSLSCFSRGEGSCIHDSCFVVKLTRSSSSSTIRVNSVVSQPPSI